MGFPDHIERVMEVAHPPKKVWDAITTAEGLGAWFGNTAAIDLRPGGLAQVTWDGGPPVDLRVERVEEPSVFGFTWRIDGMPEDDPRRTYVEFTLEPTDGGTRLRVLETGFAQLPENGYKTGFASHNEGWTRELGELAEYLDAA
ncbi:SRPBCC domain-containing protein [Amycolatopsis sp. NPDC088138]|uniref:SRPBCC domain-containing protein n=1 Tax=Amycolatopsis sp. NPDC088138 TaxID=3363938 RepID=UPI003825540D